MMEKQLKSEHMPLHELLLQPQFISIFRILNEKQKAALEEDIKRT
jgi:hypothetical protein